MSVTLRTALESDLTVLNEIAHRAFDVLLAPHFPRDIRHLVIRELVGVDCRLLSELSLYVAMSDGRIVGCGGWGVGMGFVSAAGQQRADAGRDHEAGVVRSFFVDPDYVRRGVASELYKRCERDALRSGLNTFELMATIPGAALYRRLGFSSVGFRTITLSNGYRLPSEHMRKAISMPLQVR